MIRAWAIAAVGWLAVLVATSPVFAETFPLPPKNPAATISFPDSWTVEQIDDGVESVPKDESLYLSVEVVDAVDLKGALQEAIEYLVSKGVEVNVETERKQSYQVNGLDFFDVGWKGKDEDGDTTVGVTVVALPKGKLLMFVVWGPEEAYAKHRDALDSIVRSVQATR